MKTTLAMILFTLSVFELRPATVQSGPLEVLAEFPGSSLKWVCIVEPILEQKKLDINNYTVTVVDEGDTVTVIVNSPGLSKNVRGSRGKYSAFEVEINKKDQKVVDSHFDR